MSRSLLCLIAAGGAVLAWVVYDELRTSKRQAEYFSSRAQDMWYWAGPGPSPSIRFPQAGPYNRRLGYADLPEITRKLASHGYTVGIQARQTSQLAAHLEAGYSPPYRDKTRAGLRVLDCRRDTLYGVRHPPRGYESFGAIPPLIVATLLFIENRQLLDPTQPQRNPAVEWPRLGRAVLEHVHELIDPTHDAPGASTLATQMEKYRHSASGLTASVREKFRQMYSASLRAYAGGRDTTAAREAIVVDYLNTVPLAAIAGYGEVSGFKEALWTWYGLDPDVVDRALRRPPADASALHAYARAYRAVLSLLISQRRPSYLLSAAPDQLAALTDRYLQILADAGIISADVRDAALVSTIVLARTAHAAPAQVTAWKAAYAIRIRLSALLDRPSFYDLDRLDLEVTSAFDGVLQERVRRALEQAADPQSRPDSIAAKVRLAGNEGRGRVTYSFTLYERGANANYLRVQTDTGTGPFDMNEGSRVELGSTAKLRTLATYLDIVAALHAHYAGVDRDRLERIPVDRRDRLTRWTVDYLADAEDRSLTAMLEAALARRYSASPAERFFTAGGVHRFSNFSSRDNGRYPTLAEAFRASINLPFVRLMRDIVDHHLFGGANPIGAVLDDPAHDARGGYLARFADFEGTAFLRRFYPRYSELDRARILQAMAARLKGIPARLAVVFRTIAPRAGIGELGEFLGRHSHGSTLDARELQALYERYGVDRYSLHDRGYIAQVHPLELWLAAYLAQRPQATFAEAVAASAAERQQVYQWLHKRSKRAQDLRIRTLLEIEAFERIHAQWARLGFPFEALVPSYATAIGVSGDAPAALAELIGIILNGGIRAPVVRTQALHFARGTPYETLFERRPDGSERVLAPEVAAALKSALVDVVERGTARRLDDTYRDRDGSPLVVGGKTGTGDNRHDVFGSGGVLLESRSVSRTATFAFFLGEHHYGVVTAYVPAPHARSYRFTSALPVQIVKDMAPLLVPRLTGAVDDGCSARQAARALQPNGTAAH